LYGKEDKTGNEYWPVYRTVEYFEWSRFSKLKETHKYFSNVHELEWNVNELSIDDSGFFPSMYERNTSYLSVK
jgi:hypothetical protein